MRAFRDVLVALAALALGVGCATESAPAITEMVYFWGGTESDPLEYLFGDDTACDIQTGKTADGAQAFPRILVALKPFALDVHEVTNAQYDACVRADGCEALPPSVGAIQTIASGDNYPVVRVTGFSAAAYCAFVGKRLPTEVEWEYAVRGAGKQDGTWPFGNEMAACGGKQIAVGSCNHEFVSDGSAAPSYGGMLGRSTDPASGLGAAPRPSHAVPVATSSDDAIAVEGVGVVYDLIGNVSEWMGHAKEPFLTCVDDARFVAECGAGCAARCGALCVDACLACDYCNPDKGGRDDCYVSGGVPVCIEYPADYVLPENHAFPDGEEWVVRGANYGAIALPDGVLTAFFSPHSSSCALRCSWRDVTWPKGESDYGTADWLGFRCAKSL